MRGVEDNKMCEEWRVIKGVRMGDNEICVEWRIRGVKNGG